MGTLQLEEAQECCVCFDDFYGMRDGVTCDGDNQHFTCTECFKAHVTSSCTDEMRKQEMRAGKVHCPYCVFPPTADTCDSAPFSGQLIAGHCDAAGFKLYQEARVRLLEAKLAREAEVTMEKRIAAELAKMKLLGKEVFEARKHIIEEILTLKCPKCKQAFVDFSGCMALTCSAAGCNCNFCGWCLADCGADAHPHIKTCKERAPGITNQCACRHLNLSLASRLPFAESRLSLADFATSKEYEGSWKKRRIKLLNEYLRKLSPDIQAKVLENTKNELQGIGIKANMLTL